MLTKDEIIQAIIGVVRNCREATLEDIYNDMHIQQVRYIGNGMYEYTEEE